MGDSPQRRGEEEDGCKIHLRRSPCRHPPHPHCISSQPSKQPILQQPLHLWWFEEHPVQGVVCSHLLLLLHLHLHHQHLDQVEELGRAWHMEPMVKLEPSIWLNSEHSQNIISVTH